MGCSQAERSYWKRTFLNKAGFFMALYCLLGNAAVFTFSGKTPCRVKLKSVLELPYDSPHGKKASLVEAKDLKEAGAKERALAKDTAELKVTKGSKIRKPEEVEAWLVSFSNRVKAIRDGAAPRMSIEQFLGMINGGMGRAGFHIDEIFKEFGIKHVRLVGKKDFKSVEAKKLKDEIVLEVPDFPVDDPRAAALWIKDLNLALHEVATDMISKKMDSMSQSQAKEMWNGTWKKRLTQMDNGILNSLAELDAYMKSKDPKEENPLVLASRSLSPAAWYHFSSLYKATDTFVGGATGAYLGQQVAGEQGAFVGGVAGIVVGVFTKVKYPLQSWTPNLKKMFASREAYAIERSRLDDRLTSYYSYRLLDKAVTRIVQGGVVLTSLGMASYLYHNRSMSGETQEGLAEEAQNVDKLDAMSDAQLERLNKEDLEKSYNDLLGKEKRLIASRSLAERKK
ncbi:MAG: hypothetical protein R3A80_10980 [Bdellovibrionota bacterium]